MPADPCVWLAPVVLIYGALVAGALLALAVRAGMLRGNRRLSAREAGWLAALPLVAVLLLPAAGALRSFPVPAVDACHQAWHRWEQAVHVTAASHAALHCFDVLFVGWVAAGLLRAVRIHRRAVAFVRALHQVGRKPVTADLGDPPTVWRVATSLPLCMTAGCWRPAVFLTDALEAALSPSELRAALAHEAAHVRRRDPFFHRLFHLLYALVPFPGGFLLVRDWEAAAERACDQAAARELGSARQVARALVRVAALVGSPIPVAGVVGFASGGDEVQSRVDALLAPPVAPERTRLAAATFLCLLTLVLADRGLPHLVELIVHH